MSKATFSGPVRVGAKPYLAGSVILSLDVPADAAEVIGNLPPGAIILGGVATEDGVVATVTDGTTTATVTTATANTPVDSDDVTEMVAAGEIEITSAGAAGAVLRLRYTLADASMGANQ